MMQNGDTGFVKLSEFGPKNEGPFPATVIAMHESGLVDMVIELPAGHPARPEGGKSIATLPQSAMVRA